MSVLTTALATRRGKLGALVATAAAASLTVTVGGATAPAGGQTFPGLLTQVVSERQNPTPGQIAEESHEAATAAEQFAQARTAPGIVDAGAYGAAAASLSELDSTKGDNTWKEQTNTEYFADDPYFRDYYSNSGTGDVNVTGRITGVATGQKNNVFAAGANGGVWRSITGGGNWTPIADGLPSLSSGALRTNGGQLWYATGEANTGGTAYVGSGVYAIGDAATGSFTPTSLVGGHELESTVINDVVFGGNRVWAATNRGVWSHSTDLTRHRSDPWTFEYAPNLNWMPLITDDNGNVLVPEGADAAGDSGATNAAYKNIVNDIVVDPKNPAHVVASIAWRSGDTYNGFYELNGKKGSKNWHKIEPIGAIKGKDIGNTTFAFAADGSALYAIVQSPQKLQTGDDTVLAGIYVSKKGKIAGPWNLIATSDVLAKSGSALDFPGYRPGIQAWYNQFMVVDPTNPQHVYVGLEEVYETKDGGKNWSTPGPYWNFGFACWGGNLSDGVYKTPTVGCNSTTHPDQHDATIGMVNGTLTFFAGNDGGVYSRPANGKADASGHATDWKTLNDGTIDSLQYYGIGIGAAKASTINGLPDQSTQHYPTEGNIISGGLQDNGGSILFDKTKKMSSNFGGDGGDVLVDPNDGCNIVQEYVYLSMRVTNSCAQASEFDSFVNTDAANTRSIDPGDPSPRFIAPFSADQKNIDHWVAGGEYVWAQGNGFAIKSGDDWTPVADTGARHSITALASSDDVVYAGWCGTCNNSGFKRGLTRVNISYDKDGKPTGKQTDLVLPADLTSIPNRYIGGIGIDPANSQHVFLAVNGFSRRFTEGPGAGVGHVWESTNGGTTWTDASDNLPDVPASSIKVTDTGALVLGTDLGALYRAPVAEDGVVPTWQKLGTNLPLTVVMDVELFDGDVYVGTHGRGIWKITLPASTPPVSTLSSTGSGSTGGTASTPAIQSASKGKGSKK